MSRGDPPSAKPKKKGPALPKHQNGKGDSPRNISNKFKDNYDHIDWGRPKKNNNARKS